MRYPNLSITKCCNCSHSLLDSDLNRHCNNSRSEWYGLLVEDTSTCVLHLSYAEAAWKSFHLKTSFKDLVNESFHK